MRRLGLLLLALSLTACGARSELPGDTTKYLNSDCSQPRIGFFGNPGTYDSGQFEAWLTSSGAEVSRTQTLADEPLIAESLQSFDVVVLDWLTRDYTEAEAASFAEWIAGGGGAISLTGYDNNTTDDWHANSLLAPLQVGYSGALINGQEDGSAYVTDLADHPIFEGLSSVVFKGGYAVADLGGTATTRTPIAAIQTLDGNMPVGVAVESGKGRVFVWGDEWIEFLSEGPEPDFPPQLWVQAFGWTAPEVCRLTPPE